MVTELIEEDSRMVNQNSDLISQMRKLLDKGWNLKGRHVYHEANQVADTLAKMVYDTTWALCITRFLPMIFTAMLANSSGARFRVVS